MMSDLSGLDVEFLRLDKNFLPDDFFRWLSRRFGFGSRLIFIKVFLIISY